MIDEPVERILVRLERPVEPRPEFREALLRHLVAELTSGSTQPQVARRGGHRRPTLRLVRDGLLAAAMVVLALGLGIFIHNLRQVGPIAPAPVAPTATPTRQVAPPSLHLGATIAVGYHPGAIAVAWGSVWVGNLGNLLPVASPCDGCNAPAEPTTVSRIDPSTSRVIATIPAGASGMAADDSAVWVTEELNNSLMRIDPQTNRVIATIPVGGSPHGVAIGEGAVWVANFAADRTLTRVDPQTNHVSATVVVPGAEVQRVAVGYGSVWAPSADGRLLRIDPKTNRVTETISIPQDALDAIVGEGAVWVDINPQLAGRTGQGSVVRVDPETNRVVAMVKVGHNPNGIAAAGGAVFVVNQDDGTLTEIDPRTNAVVGKPLAVGKGTAGVALGTSAAWVANHGDGTVARVDFSR